MGVFEVGETLFDKYRLERLLGQGAFGEVYLVTHLKLNAPRALKVLRKDAPGMGSTIYNSGKERFFLEAQLGARLKNEHLVQVYDFEEKDQDLILLMEYAPGGSLAERLAGLKASGHKMGIEEAQRIAGDIAQGLAALHAEDIVHRDLKPSNILFDQNGSARVADLGLAQVPGAGTSRSLLGSSVGGEMPRHPGTLAYMSPEQSGQYDYLTSASDVYSLGLILFEMLTGRNFKNQLPGAHLSDLRQDMPAWLDALVVSMLDDNPKKRPWNGEKVLAALQAGVALDRQEKARQAEAEKKQREADEAARLLKVKLAQDALEQEASRKAEAERRQGQAEARDKLKNERKPPSGSGWKWVFGVGAALIIIILMFSIFPNLMRPKPTLAPPMSSAPATALGIGSTQISDKDGMTLLYIPAGDFQMGSDNGIAAEKPLHTVSLDAFWIDQTDVTNAMFARCVSAGACQPPHYTQTYAHPDYYGSNQYSDYPVIYVDWNQADAYCRWAGRSLPTEAQWEKAARGTDGRTYPWGEGIDKSKANYNENVGDTSKVSSYPAGASPYGALDMAGNVWQWVADWYDNGYYAKSPAKNPAGPTAGKYRVLRGGSSGDLNEIVRTSVRNNDDPASWHDNYGFRCATSH